MSRLKHPPAWLVEAVAVAAILGAYVVYVWPTLDRPLLEKHAFRQTQTAYPARIFHEEGVDLVHPKLPVLGEPFEVPFEFPLFQAGASVVMDLGVDDDRAMRLTGLLCFLLTALLLFGLVRHVAGSVSAVASVGAFVLTPFALVWGRASMIEYLATAGGVGFAWATIVWRERGRPLPAALALVAGLVGMLVKPTTAAFWILPALGYRPEPQLGPVPRRATRIGLVLLVAVPLVATLAWTRHADSIKAKSPATEWLTSDSLHSWTFGSLGQRLDVDVWDVILSRIGLTLLGPAGIVLLAVALVATIRSAQRRFWLAVWFAATGPMLVFTNLHFQHDYYLAAISPALAALIGLACGAVWARVPSHVAPRAIVLGLAVVLVYGTLETGRGYWLRIHGADDDPQVLPLARQIAAHTTSTDLVATVGLDWDPAVLYYAGRQGHMVTDATEDVAWELIHDDGYRFLMARELDSSGVRELERWRYLGALDRNLYELADEPGELEARFVTTDAEPTQPPRSTGGTEVPCNAPFAIPSSGAGTWLRLREASPAARIQVSDDLAPLPPRRYVWISSLLAAGGTLEITCSGDPSLRVEAIGSGPGPAGRT